MSTISKTQDADYRAGYQQGWRDGLAGEPEQPSPHASETYRDGWQQGWRDAMRRPVRREK